MVGIAAFLSLYVLPFFKHIVFSPKNTHSDHLLYLGEIDAALRTQAEEFLANAVKAHYVSLPIFDIILSFAKTLLLFSIQTK